MIAIDFGTTNSSAAVLSDEDSQPRLQKIGYGDRDSIDANIMPSAVCSCRDGQCQSRSERFGHEALRHHFGLQHDSTLLHEMKLDYDRSTLEPPTVVERPSGLKFKFRDEGGFLTAVPEHYHYKTYKGRVPLEPKDFVPGTAKLVNEVVRLSDATEKDRRQIAIGVPASFSDRGRSFLREAVKRAVFGERPAYENIALYPEPLAAARSYMKIHAGNVLVLDYGGGTLDITVMTLTRTDVFEGDKVNHTGLSEAGSRMDQAILEHQISRQPAEVQAWFDAAPLRTRLTLKRNVEKAKIELATKPEAIVELPGTNYDPIRLNDDIVSIALQAILARMTGIVSQAVTRHLGGLDAVDFVVMSGGTSLSRPVQNSIRAIFNHIPEDRFVLPDARKPEQVEMCMCAVARGLALLHKDGFKPLELPLPRVN